LPGNWEAASSTCRQVSWRSQIGDHGTAVLMHNDGVVQGLSKPFMDVEHWAC
jgi:hypothetical protein